MFVCLVLIGLTSDVVCVRVYYRGCVVISNLGPKPPTPPSHQLTLFPQCPTPLLLNTSLKVCSPNTPSPNNPHEELSWTHTHTHTHMPLLMPPNRHIPCVFRAVMDCPKKPSILASLCLSLFPFFRVQRGHLRHRDNNQLD